MFMMLPMILTLVKWAVILIVAIILIVWIASKFKSDKPAESKYESGASYYTEQMGTRWKDLGKPAPGYAKGAGTRV